MPGFDVAAVLKTANELAKLHPSLTFISLAICLTVGCGILLKILCVIDLMLVKHVRDRRRVIAGLPARPRRGLRFLRALRLLRDAVQARLTQV